MEVQQARSDRFQNHSRFAGKLSTLAAPELSSAIAAVRAYRGTDGMHGARCGYTCKLRNLLTSCYARRRLIDQVYSFH
jgi:hypothetical protein